jgi:AmmeMemoRadiSam system protein B/AmmeMemoRadiSam system protein A
MGDMKMHQSAKVFAILAALLLTAVTAGSQAAEKVRQPEVAGAFYPANPNELARMVDGFIAKTQSPAANMPLLALVSPHAGYQYSGQVAAYSYALLNNRHFQRVVVIAPSHQEAFDFASVYGGDAYSTPLGRVPIDKEFVRKLVGKGGPIRLSTKGHDRAAQQAEHALEVQLPFLQRTLHDFQLVPVVMGDQSYEASRALGVALAKLIGNSDTLIVASSDLSHFHSYDDASKIDHNTLQAIQDYDYFNLSRNLQARVWEACGGAPIVATMIAAERLGANRAVLLKYANSGDVTGDRSRVVGYGALALFKADSRKAATPAFSLTAKEKQELLQVARKSVETAVREHGTYQPQTSSPALLRDRGAFVTITNHGQLRGCIGFMSPMEPLIDTVRDVAAFAALRDPRFPHVSTTELPELQYEISVLSPLQLVKDVKEIRLGQHGLVMKNGDHEGVLLPQVPVEQGWDRKTFLDETAHKAGLPASAWKAPDTDLFRFTALVFSEKQLDPVAPEASLPAKQQ